MRNISGTVSVAVSGTLYSFDIVFDYVVPTTLWEKAEVGKRVIIPFGNGNKKRIGVIMRISPEYIEGKRLKAIVSVIDDKPVLNDEMLKLIYWLKDNTFCTYFDAVKTILPTGMNISLLENYSMTANPPIEPLTEEEKNTFDYLTLAKNKREFDEILDIKANPEKKIIVEGLLKKGVIKKTDSVKQSINDASIKMIRPSESWLSQSKPFKLTAKQKEIMNLLEENGSVSIKEACYICSVTPIVVKNLIKNDALEDYDYEIFRVPQGNTLEEKEIDGIELSDQQKEAYQGISKALGGNKPQCFLLHGITGSGKTAIFHKLISKTITDGRQALMLIPEISLTPQTVKGFKELFGETVAVLHSQLPLSQRFDEYKRIKQGKAKIVIGTRSAVFAPLDNIGIIVMDEEGDNSYKSESNPRYNTLDIAKQRCKYHNSVLLLASATPSIESYYNAVKGNYTLLELTERFFKSELPDVKVVDMKQERNNGNYSAFSNQLLSAIQTNLSKKEQTILLLNRRGYHSIVTCIDCGEPVYCPNCSVPLTYHKVNNNLICHYCGHMQTFEEKCPACGGLHIKQTGYGTQKLQEELQSLFPQARILRMDADTNFSRYSYEKHFSDFGEGKYDIMLGTQMISKGLDFPNVSLVGVLSVDGILFSGDFKAYERTFSLITQVIGRGGRGTKRGSAYLQTYNPDHYIIELSASQDYKEFFNEEMSLRKIMLFPPICDTCVLGLSSPIEQDVIIASQTLIKMLADLIKEENIKMPLRVIGPSKCNYEKIKSQYRYRILLKCKNNADFRGIISRLLILTGKYKEFNKVVVYADINGEISS